MSKSISIKRGKVESIIFRAVSMILRNDMSNILIRSDVCVSSVNMSKDLRIANIYISIFNINKTFNDKAKLNILKELNSAAGFIRNNIYNYVEVRCCPRLVFKLNEGNHMN